MEQNFGVAGGCTRAKIGACGRHSESSLFAGCHYLLPPAVAGPSVLGGGAPSPRDNPNSPATCGQELCGSLRAVPGRSTGANLHSVSNRSPRSSSPGHREPLSRALHGQAARPSNDCQRLVLGSSPWFLRTCSPNLLKVSRRSGSSRKNCSGGNSRISDLSFNRLSYLCWRRSRPAAPVL